MNKQKHAHVDKALAKACLSLPPFVQQVIYDVDIVRLLSESWTPSMYCSIQFWYIKHMQIIAEGQGKEVSKWLPASINATGRHDTSFQLLKAAVFNNGGRL